MPVAFTISSTVSRARSP
ncbi:hypothetical protein VHUM_00186 [Vanrija humicola]|uniref:Uncharacterized protein n=1 Tax=Vanrija humicola TaxID=5417 RepID=A0A7D8Z7I2_VANHU|nr:hypothetical protein VHUM_00186 [Vanrija humicola]